jgi:hypothetical protein
MKSGVKTHFTQVRSQRKKTLAAQDDRSNVVGQTALRLS